MRKWNYCSSLVLLAGLSFSMAAKASDEAAEANATSAFSVEQNKEVILEGIVTDKDGIELPGVSVAVEGTTYGTVTDIGGRYHLKFPGKHGQKIIYSFVGMKSQAYIYNGAASHNVVLESDDIALDDVVVIGYGSKNKKSLTSSIASMDKKEMERLSATSATMDNMLAGTIKGVMVTTTSGEPGASLKINVRGVTSPYPNMVSGGDNNIPLYVIDGVPMFMENNALNPLMNIAPSDIESIDVLKDAAATAIYGSRGANGVIIVKTKGGRKGEKVSVEAGYTFSVGNPVKNYDPLSTSEFMNLQNTILKSTVNAANAGMANVFYIVDVMNRFGKVGVLSYDEYGSPLSLSYDGPDASLYGSANTDWAQEVRNKNAMTHQYNVAIRGGSEKTNYSFSFNGLNQEGLLLNDNLERYGARLSLDTEINKYLSVGATLNYSYSNRKSGSQESFMGSSSGTWQTRPDVSVRDENGNLNRIDISGVYGIGGGMFMYDANPVAQLQRKAEYVNDQFLGSAYAEITPLKGLKFRADMNISRYAFKSNYFSPSKTQQRMEMPEYGMSEPMPSTLSTYDNGVTTTSINFRADYSMNIDKHAITVMAGYGADRYWMDSHTNMYQGFPNDEVLDNPGSASMVAYYSDFYSRSGLNSVYGRATYDYDSRYLLEASLRADASSKFGPSNQWGVFPAVSLGWRINNEKFLKEIEQIDDLKLRLSWGKTGSTNVADFAYKQFFVGSNKYMESSTTTLEDMLPNTGVRWEMTTEYNAGFDFSFFNNRLTGSLEVYHRYTDGALAPAPHILESGFGSYYDNIIDMTNNGVEFNIGGDIIRTKDFTWNTNFNIAANRNKIKSLNGATISTYMQDAYIEGMPAGTMRGYKVKGICQDLSELDALNAASPTGTYQANTGVGDYIMEDTDHNGMIDTNDRVVIANPEPKCFGGWLNTLTYKDLSLSFLFQYQCGGEALYSNLQTDMTGALGQSVLRELYGNTWTPENPDARYAQLVYMGYNSYNLSASDRYVFKTSYLRLKNITLSYNLPQPLITKWGVQNASVFATATNLFTITDWPGLDPEAIGTIITTMSTVKDPYPMSRTFSLGLKVQF